MNVPARTFDFKYNPGFKEDRNLQDDFIVRKRELKLLLEIVEGNTGASSNRHVLLIGPRGAGKTTLVRRIQAELRLNPAFSKSWAPIAFGEESYSVTSAGEFWLECLYHLQKSKNSEFLERRYEELRDIADNDALQDAALATLIDQAHAMDRRFLLIVENLNVLLEEQMSEKDAWAFRHALQNHPEIMLLATATSSFKQIESDEMALFDQFKVHYVGPLSVKDCRLLWYRVSGDRLLDQQVRPIQILTGGNPRLIRILAEFALDNVFFQLVNKLSFMIDQYTDYFKSQLDILPTSERKVFVALLELWDPALTREVARIARVTTNTAGAYLDRLERRGAVVKAEGRWQASERLFNIYYLMRRRGAPSSRVHALVRFMTVYYEPDQLANRVRELAAEACHLKPADRQDHYYAVSALVTQFAPGQQRSLLSAFPRDFFQDPDLPAPIARLQALRDEVSSTARAAPPPRRGRRDNTNDAAQLEAIVVYLADQKLDEAEAIATKFVQESGGSVTALFAMALLNLARGRAPQAEEWLRRALDADPSHVPTWQFLANYLLEVDRDDEAVEAARKVVELDGASAAQWVLLARALAGADQSEAAIEEAYQRALEIDEDQPDALVWLAKGLAERGELVQAQALYERAIRVEPIRLPVIGAYADFLIDDVDDDLAAEKVLRQITTLFPEEAQAWVRLALHIGAQADRQVETLELLKTATEVAETDPRPWIVYAEYMSSLDRVEDAARHWRQALELDSESAELWVLFGRFLRRHELNSEAETAFLKAIELKPNDGDAWEHLGLLLLEQADRTRAAESALIEASKRSPEACSPVHSLGRLYEKEGRFAEAEAQYRKALELRPECGCALDDLLSKRSGYGADLPDAEALIEDLLKRHPKQARAHLIHARYLRYAKRDLSTAKGKLLFALSLGTANQDVWSEVAEILVETELDLAKAAREFLDLVEQYGPCEHMLNTAAWRLHLAYGARAADLALAIAKKAFERDPQSWQIAHTLAAIHIDAADAPSTLALLPLLLSDFDEYELAGLIDIVIDLARMDGEARSSILEAIEVAQREPDLEPLVVALRLLGGQPVHVAKEVMEVANDIVARIQSDPAP